MKLILGDNQFFGINHVDLDKARETKILFENSEDIVSFINESLSLGMNGFMLNSNLVGYKIIASHEFDSAKEIHYSIPYARKFATIVNETGIYGLAKHILLNTSILSSLIPAIKFLATREFKHVIPVALNAEIPRNLRKDSVIYLQNIMTDFLIGLGQSELIIEFIRVIRSRGYRPGIVTLNPLKLIQVLEENNCDGKDIIICFNINESGFNVFPSLTDVESLIFKQKDKYSLMGMSIFSSGAGNIQSSLRYIKSLELDYCVFGSSKLSNIEKNIEYFNCKA